MNLSTLNEVFQAKYTKEKRFILILRLVIILSFTCIFQLMAENIPAQNVKVNIKKTNAQVRDVLNEIEQQTKYLFVYNEQVDVQRRVSIYSEDKPVLSVLAEVFKNSEVNYRVEGNHILLSKIDKPHNEAGTQNPNVPGQEKSKLSGKIADESGSPIIGASITEVNNRSNGTITDQNGNFTLVVKKNTEVEISYIGYIVQKIFVTKDLSLNIALKEDNKTLGEIVVVGYGTQRKENLTGAVNTVDVSKALSGRAIADVGRGLQGSAPGLSVIVGNGEVGSDAVLKIRGQIGSLFGDSKPLILLDNVEIPSIQLVNPNDVDKISILKDAASTSIYGSKGAFGVILITTKKGSSEEAINVQYSTSYGWQNVAKPIKMGTIDALEYSVICAERVNAPVYGAFWMVNRGSYEKSKEWSNLYGNSVKPDDPMVYGRDWYYDGKYKMGIRMYDSYHYMIREWAPILNHSLTVNGHSGKTYYNIGLDYLNQTGMLKAAKKDDFTKYNASVKVSSEINKFLTIRAGSMFSSRTKRYPYVTTSYDPWLYLYRWSSLFPLSTEGGNSVRSPVSEIQQANTGSQQWNYTNLNLGATINITKDWTLDGDFTFANQEAIWLRPGTRFTAGDAWSAPILKKDENGNQIYVNDKGETVPATATGAIPAYKLNYTTYTASGATPDHIYRSAENWKQRTTNVYSTYNLKLGDSGEHAMKFMAGMNLVSSEMNSHWSQKSMLMVINNPQFDLATGTQTAGGYSNWESQLGFFGRANYAYADKILLEANIRRDGSNKFPTKLRWRWFPSFSAGWRVTEEQFMKPLYPYLSSFKIRGSWGTIGDQTIPGSLYASYLYSILPPPASPPTNFWLNGETKNSFFYNPDLVQPDIRWQDINTLDIGFDMRLFSDKLGISFDWFKRTNQNMLVAGSQAPYTLGTTAPVGNYGNLTTYGWEVSVDFNHRFRNGVGLSITATLADAVTYVTKYQEGATKLLSPTTQFFEGKRYGDIYGYTTDRLYQWSDFDLDANGKLQLIELTANETSVADYIGKKAYKLKTVNGQKPIYQVFLQNSSNFLFGPGDVKFVDVNGDGEINNGKNVLGNQGDLSVIGNATPRFQYSFRIGADYKGFDASVFLQGVGLMKSWEDGSLAIPGYQASDGGIPQTFAGNFWKEGRENAFYPRPFNNGSDAFTRYSSAINNMQIQSKYILDLAYLRIKNITVGYTLPAGITKKIYISKARFYVGMENFLTFDGLRGLPIDPEAIAGQNPGMSGANQGAYNLTRIGVGAPMFKTLSLGAQINF